MELKAGYKKTEIGIIPEDWECVSMGEVGNTIIGLTYSPSNVRDYGLLVLRSSNIQQNQLKYENNVFVEMDVPKRVLVKENDILICVRNGSKQLIGKCALIDKNAEGFAFGAFMSIYRSQFPIYIYYSFQSNIIQKQIDETMGATINQITNKNLDEFKIGLPPLPEQKAIATVLSDTDSLIQALEKKIAKKQLIKKGAMQKLLSPTDPTTGKIKEGWEVKTLGKIAVILKGKQLNKEGLNELDLYPVINGGILPSGYTDIWNQKTKTITISEGGNSCGFVNFIKTNFWQGGHCYSIEPKINKYYLYQFLKSNEKKIMKLRVGSGLPNIQKHRLIEFEISIPSTTEQTRIAQILSNMDSEIETLEKKLKKYKQIKQGLMQVLLTGKIRLV